MESLVRDGMFFEQGGIYMRVWKLAFVLIIITGASLQGKGAQQEGRLFAESNDDSSTVRLTSSTYEEFKVKY